MVYGGGYNEIKRQTITPFKALQITKIGGMTNTNYNAFADKLKALHTSKLDFKYHFNLTYEMKKYLEFARNSRFWFDELKKRLRAFLSLFRKSKKYK